MNNPIESSTRWASVLVLFLAGIGAALQFAKVPPALTAVSQALSLGPVEAGFAVSVVGMVGVVLGIAVGSLVAAAGPRRALVVALAFAALFALLGSMSPNDILFMMSRVLEGVAHLVIVVAAPGLMITSTTSRDRPIAMALWSCFFSVGFSFASATAPMLLALIGWRGFFVGHAMLMLGLSLLALVFVVPDRDRPKMVGVGTVLSTHLAVYRSGPPMILALVFCCYTILFLAILTYLNKHLISVDGFTPATSGTIMALLALANPVVSLATGPIVRSGFDPIRGFIVSFILVIVGATPIFLGFTAPVGTIACALIMMAALGALPGLAFTMLPKVAPTSALAAKATGAIAQFGNVGTFSGPPLFAMLLATIGWVGGAIFVIVASLAGIGLAVLLRRVMLNPT